MFCGWVATLFIGMAISAGLFAQGVYAPSLPSARNSITYQRGIASDNNATLNALAAAFPGDPQVAAQQAKFAKMTNTSGSNVWPMSSANPNDALTSLSETTALEKSLLAPSAAVAGR